MSGYIACPNCKGQMRNDGSLAGRKVACPMCGTHFIMPAPSSPAAPAAPVAPAVAVVAGHPAAPEFHFEPGSTLPERAARIHRKQRNPWYNVLLGVGILSVLCCGGVGVFATFIYQNFQLAIKEMEQHARTSATPFIREHQDILKQAGYTGGSFEAKEVEITIEFVDFEPLAADTATAAEGEPPDESAPEPESAADAAPPAAPDAAAPPREYYQVARVKFVSGQAPGFFVVMFRPFNEKSMVDSTTPWTFADFEFPDGTPKPRTPAAPPADE